MTQNKREEAVMREMVYMGESPHMSGHRWGFVEEAGRHLFYKKKLVSSARPGGIYRLPVVEGDGTTSVWSGEAEYVGLWPNVEDRQRWDAEDRIARTRRSMNAKAAKEAYATSIEGQLESLRKLYRQSSAQGKNALLALIIQEVTKP